jgi:hypothetical protein
VKKLAVLLLALLPLQASADVISYNKCTVSAGKTFADVQAWLTDWRALVKKEGVDYQVRLLVPHADAQVGLADFFIEGSTSTFESYGKAFQLWYGSAPAWQASNAQLTAAASCDGGSIYRTAD